MNRIERLRQAIDSHGADAALISHPANRHYVSGFPAADYAPDESAGVVLVTESDAILFVSPTNLPWAEAAVLKPVAAMPWERPWPQFLGKQIQTRGLRRVLFEDRALTVADHAAVSEAAGIAQLIPAGATFHALRARKDDTELEEIATAARITDAALAAAMSSLEAGTTERELVWRIERAMRDFGADGPAFPTIVAAGPHGARPHHEPTDRPIAAGEPIVIDLGAKFQGYCGDLTRTLVVGESTPLFRERYNSVLEVQRQTLASIRPGMSGKVADRIARDGLAAAGFEREFLHGLGHGVGLLIHESPSLGTQSNDVLETGQVITIEPGIYFEDWGGIRIEDLCVVTPDGLKILSNAPK
jgi:Xaa-Pro aminopeptidase